MNGLVPKHIIELLIPYSQLCHTWPYLNYSWVQVKNKGLECLCTTCTLMQHYFYLLLNCVQSFCEFHFYFRCCFCFCFLYRLCVSCFCVGCSICCSCLELSFCFHEYYDSQQNYVERFMHLLNRFQVASGKHIYYIYILSDHLTSLLHGCLWANIMSCRCVSFKWMNSGPTQ